MATVYAVKNFEKLVVRGSKWEEFDRLAERLILGANGRKEGRFAINIGQMQSAAESEMKSFGNSDPEVGDALSKHHKQMYAELSDGAHATQWGIIGHAEVRVDGLGIRWHRQSQESSVSGHLIDLSLCLRLLREWLERLEEIGGHIEEAARRVEKQDPEIRRSTVAYLRHLLEEEAGAVSQETKDRIKPVLEYMEAQLAERDEGA